MMCAGLNSATWWIRNEDKKKALIIANLLEYYIGYYFDDFNYISNWIDTIISVKELNNDIRVFGLLEIIHNALILFPDLKILIENMQCPDFKIEEYTLNKKLNYFIYKKSKKRLKGKTLNVVELKRFIQKYGLTYKKTYPYEIKNELYKIHINKTFKENIIKFKKKNKIKIQELFFATYSSLIEKPYFTKSCILKLVFEGDKDKIIKYFSSYYEKMYFFNLMLSEFEVKEFEKRIMNPDDFEKIKPDVSPFFISRKKLIFNLLKNAKNFKEFILKYFELNEEEIRTFDVFLRNCVRYDIIWPIIPKVDGNLKSFALKYNITQKRVALGYYSFEDNERLFLDSIIEKFL
ncbi:hypothetical protein [Marinitoga aeolica]|nr:hypothetical protein [Marinitoga aeolica]